MAQGVGPEFKPQYGKTKKIKDFLEISLKSVLFGESIENWRRGEWINERSSADKKNSVDECI
jgi:hypothetical protein